MPATETYEGPITLTKKGIGFFSPPSAIVKKDRDKNADLLIPAEATAHAPSGDIVEVIPTGMYRDPSGRMPPRDSGKVVKILKRARETFVGTLVEPEAGRYVLEPDSKKMHMGIDLHSEGKSDFLKGVLTSLLGDKVVV